MFRLAYCGQAFPFQRPNGKDECTCVYITWHSYHRLDSVSQKDIVWFYHMCPLLEPFWFPRIRHYFHSDAGDSHVHNFNLGRYRSILEMIKTHPLSCFLDTERAFSHDFYQKYHSPNSWTLPGYNRHVLFTWLYISWVCSQDVLLLDHSLNCWSNCRIFSDIPQ